MGFRPAMPFVIRPRVYTNDAQAYFSAVQAAGSRIIDDLKRPYDDYILRVSQIGVWQVLDRDWVFSTDNTTIALLDLKSRSTAIANGSPTFTAFQGYTGTDSSITVWINSNFNASTAGGNYSQNSAHHSVWINTNSASTASGGIAIGTGSTGQNHIIPKYSDGNALYRINDAGAGSAGIANANSIGHYLANRSGSSAQQGYKNGVDQGVVAVASVAPHNGNYGILAAANAGNPTFGDGHQNCGVTIGGSLTPDQVVGFYSARRALMTALGVP